MKKFLETYFGEQVDLQIRLFRMILLFSGVAGFMATVANIFVLQLGVGAVLYTVVGFFVIAVVLWLTQKLKHVDNLLFIMLLFINIGLFPGAFFESGGMNSGTPIWLLTGLLLIFLFLKGWRFYVTLAGAVISIIITYLVSILHPELVVPLADRTMEHQDSLMAILLVGLILGCLFKYQSLAYSREKEFSEQQCKNLEQMSRSKSMFFANMSHEIRTPINTIIGLNEMTLRENVSDEVAENAINIQNASKILLALINDILDLSKLESGKMEIVPVQYETASMFSDLVNIIWVRAQEKKLDFRIDIAQDIPSMLYGDEVRIKQVLTNILTNAVKYTEKGAVTLTVKGERTDHNQVRLKMSVEDTGIGIRKESLGDLFSSFKRVDQEKNSAIEGTGLGLSISRQLVDMMGGTITVDSIYHKGSIFTVSLVQNIVNDAPVGSIQYAVRKNLKDRKQYEQRFEAPDARILIVDDNEMNLMVACKLLRDTKVQIDTAKSGRECLEKTKEKFYHVIFMDHMMPGLNGEETLKLVRSQKEGFCQKSVVIALTANVMTGAAEWYRERGFEGYLAKPVNGALFEAILQKCLPSELVETAAAQPEADGAAENAAAMVFHSQKKALRITTDCVCDLPQEWLERFDVSVMYYYVTTDEGRFCDTKEVCAENLLTYIEEGHHVQSSCASVEEYETFFADNLMEAEQIIHISMASGASLGYETASLAASVFDNVTVVDSGHLSSGMGLLVLSAAQMVQDGATAQEICAQLNRCRERVSTSFIVPSSDSMYESGKIDRPVQRLCQLFALHPVLAMAQSKIKLHGIKTGNMDRAARQYIAGQMRHRRKIDDRILFITYAGCSLKQLEGMKAEVAKWKTFQTVRFQKASATISSNCGIGTFGLIYLKNK